jgi:hypothetical protein
LLLSLPGVHGLKALVQKNRKEIERTQKIIFLLRKKFRPGEKEEPVRIHSSFTAFLAYPPKKQRFETDRFRRLCRE